MKPIVRIKKIKGKEYWYEDTPYYDPEKKQIRQKSRYLGKNINGTAVKVRTAGILSTSVYFSPVVSEYHSPPLLKPSSTFC